MMCLLVSAALEAKNKPFGNGLYWKVTKQGEQAISGSKVKSDYKVLKSSKQECRAGGKVRGELRTEINGFQWYCYKNKEAYSITGEKIFPTPSLTSFPKKGIQSIFFTAVDKNDPGIFVVCWKEDGKKKGAFMPDGRCIVFSSGYDFNVRRIAVEFTNPYRKKYYTFFNNCIFDYDSNKTYGRIEIFSFVYSYKVKENFFIITSREGMSLVRYDGVKFLEKADRIDYIEKAHHFKYTSNGYMGIIDANGNELANKLTSVSYEDGIIKVRKNESNGILGFSGQWIISTDKGYNNIVELSSGNTKCYKVSKSKYSGPYGLISSTGRIILPTEYSVLETAGGRYLRYKVGDFYGIMDYQGNVIIPTTKGYTSIGNYMSSQNSFTYTTNGYKGEVDSNCRELSRIKMESPQQTIASSGSNSDKKKSSIMESGSNYEFFSYFSYCKMENGKPDVKPNSCEGVKIDFSSSSKINISLMKNGNATESITITPSDATLTKKGDVVMISFTEYGTTKAIMIIKSFNGMSKAIAWYDNFSSTTGKIFGETGLGNVMRLIDEMNKYRGTNFDSQFNRVKSKLESYSWKNKN